MTKKNTKIIFCGLPDSGKTTFLGALSYLVEQNKESNALKCTGLKEQRHFFNNLADTWVSCEPMHRTKVDSKNSIEMTLSGGGIQFDIEMPDLSGETWGSIWSEHEISSELSDFIANCNSIVFFIHADQILTPMSISEENSMLQSQEEGEMLSRDLEEWDSSKHASTQAVSVDLLIKLSSLMEFSQKKVVIILSAWDKVNEGITPIDFVRVQLPLLHQYLSAKFDYINFKVFGVSAQGGCLEKEEQRLSLSNIDEPTERIRVSEDGRTHHNDLTKILSWLIND